MREKALCLRFPPLLHQPARAFGNEHQCEQETNRRNGGRRKHPSPICRTGAGQQVIDAVRQKNTGDNGELIERDQKTAIPWRRDFCNVQRRERGSHSDGYASYQPGNCKLKQVTWKGCSNRRDREERRGAQKNPFSPKEIAGKSSHTCSNDASKKKAACRKFRL